MVNSHQIQNSGDPAHLLARVKPWHLGGETISRLALHIHGDAAAREHKDALIEAIVALQAGQLALTLEEVNQRVAAIAAENGLTGYASNAKCIFDPLGTVVDVSFYANLGE